MIQQKSKLLFATCGFNPKAVSLGDSTHRIEAVVGKLFSLDMRIVGKGAVVEVLRGVQVGRARQGARQGGGQGPVGGGQVKDCLKRERK